MIRRHRRAVLRAGALAGLTAIAPWTGGPGWPPRERVRRGEADVDVHRRRVIENENVEYAGDGEVEIVTIRGGPDDEPRGTETVPFEEWAERECGKIASFAASVYLTEQLRALGYDEWDLYQRDYGEPIDPDLEPGVRIGRVTRVSNFRRVLAEPSIEYDRWVELAPRNASATIELDGREHECTVPVWVERIVEVSRQVHPA